MGSTAFSTAFERKGVTPRDAELQVALAKFQNNGGTYERLMELARIAYGLPGEATAGMPQGRKTSASPRQQNGDEEGQNSHAGLAEVRLPSSSPTERDGAGQLRPAEDGQTGYASSDREISPTVAARVLRAVPRIRSPEERFRALRTAQGTAVKALMKIDGIDIRDYSIGQALSAARTKDSEAYVLRVLGMMYKHVPHTTRIGDIASDSTIESVIRQSKEYSNAAAA